MKERTKEKGKRKSQKLRRLGTVQYFYKRNGVKKAYSFFRFLRAVARDNLRSSLL
jgi:hypothetical protein